MSLHFGGPPEGGMLEGMSETATSAHGALDPREDPACDVAHGRAPAPEAVRTLIVVFASPVGRFLLRYGQDAGYRPVLVDPDPERVRSDEGDSGAAVDSSVGDWLGPEADVVVTDHHRPELGPMLRDALAGQTRWIGVMGNPRHPAPHVPALAGLDVPESEIARVQRPIGLNIGSRTPAEIAIATVAGLIADRNGRPGGFAF